MHITLHNQIPGMLDHCIGHRETDYLHMLSAALINVTVNLLGELQLSYRNGEKIEYVDVPRCVLYAMEGYNPFSSHQAYDSRELVIDVTLPEKTMSNIEAMLLKLEGATIDGLFAAGIALEWQAIIKEPDGYIFTASNENAYEVMQ